MVLVLLELVGVCLFDSVYSLLFVVMIEFSVICVDLDCWISEIFQSDRSCFHEIKQNILRLSSRKYFQRGDGWL